MVLMNQSELIKKHGRWFEGEFLSVETPSTSFALLIQWLPPITAFAQWLPPIFVRLVAATRHLSAHLFVFWFNDAADFFAALLTFTSENQGFTIHFCCFEKDCYRTETSAADNIVEDLLLCPFGYFLPPVSGFWCEYIFGLNLSYHISFSFSLVGFSTCCTRRPIH